MADKPHIFLSQHGAVPFVSRTHDSYQNFLTHVGQGTGNVLDGSRYGFHPVTRNRLQMEWAYRGSWICGKAVDSVAEDMTREGVSITTDDKPQRVQKLEKEVARLRVWSSLCNVARWSRLHGGAIGYLMIEGQKADEPLNLESITKGQFRGILPLDRWIAIPNLNELVGARGGAFNADELGPRFGEPRYYETVTDSNTGVPRLKIHYTRTIRLEGVPLPHNQRMSENLWGQSVLERLWDRLIAFDSTTVGAAQLVNKAHLRTVSIEDLRSLITIGGKGMQALLAHINMMRVMQTNEGITLIDAKDKFEAHQYTFTGLDQILLQFGQQLSGALDIPLVRLFGQSPAGLNATGESDWRTYHEGIKGRQQEALGPGVELVYNIAYRSTFGGAPPASFELDFKPLYLLTDEQKAQTAEADARSIAELYDKQIYTRGQALRELRASSRITGRGASVTDEEIEQADDDEKEARANAPSPEELAQAGQIPGQRPGEPAQPNPAHPVNSPEAQLERQQAARAPQSGAKAGGALRAV